MEPTEESKGGEHPPGWYPNQNGPGYRYWDGSRWTDHYLQPEPPPSPVADPPGRSRTTAAELRDARHEIRVAVAVFGVIAGIIGLSVALFLPTSAADAGADGVYIRSEYYRLILLGSLEAIVFGVLLGALSFLRPNAKPLQMIQLITLVIGILLVAGTAFVYGGYQEAKNIPAQPSQAAAPSR